MRLQLAALDPRVKAGARRHLQFHEHCDGMFKACHLGYAIDKEHEGQGPDAGGGGRRHRHLFRGRGLHRIMASYMPRTCEAARSSNGWGSEQEVRFRDYLMINGRWEDHVLTRAHQSRWLWKSRCRRAGDRHRFHCKITICTRLSFGDKSV